MNQVPKTIDRLSRELCIHRSPVLSKACDLKMICVDSWYPSNVETALAFLVVLLEVPSGLESHNTLTKREASKFSHADFCQELFAWHSICLATTHIDVKADTVALFGDLILSTSISASYLLDREHSLHLIFERHRRHGFRYDQTPQR